jgi:hypothetical protein
MTRSSTLRCTAVLLLAASFFLPPIATADEMPRGRMVTAPTKLSSILADLWGSLVHLLPDEWHPVTAADQVDNGWQIDPNG